MTAAIDPNCPEGFQFEPGEILIVSGDRVYLGIIPEDRKLMAGGDYAAAGSSIRYGTPVLFIRHEVLMREGGWRNPQALAVSIIAHEGRIGWLYHDELDRPG